MSAARPPARVTLWAMPAPAMSLTPSHRDEPHVYIHEDVLRALWRAAEDVALLQPAAYADNPAEVATFQRFYDVLRETRAALAATVTK